MDEDKITNKIRKYKTAGGHTLTLHGISQILLQKVQNSVQMPSKPVYEITTATGVVETHEITESVLEDPSLDPVERADFQKKLDEYNSAYLMARAKLNERANNAVFLKGIEVEMPTDDTWVQEQEFLGMVVPENPMERRVHYIQTEALTTVEDLLAVIDIVMDLSGIPEESMAEARKLFRGAMGKQEPEQLEDLQRELASQ